MQAQYKEWLSKDKLVVLQGWARDGLTDEQIAHNIGIRRETLYTWKKKYPNINNALKKGKEVVDYAVEGRLLKSALEGDTTAMIFWLKNRRPDKWRDRRDVRSGNDELLKANTEKAKAEARIAVHEADQLENDNADNPLVKALYDAVKQNDDEDEGEKDETNNKKY